MTQKPVNLNRVRKQKARAAQKARADQNAVLHGLPKAAKIQARKEANLSTRKLDGMARDTGRTDTD